MAKATYEYLPSLDIVEEVEHEIVLFSQCEERLTPGESIARFQELIGRRNEAVEISKAEAVNIANTKGVRNFMSKSGKVTIRVNHTYKDDSAGLIRVHGKTILEECPNALKMVWTEVNKTSNLKRLEEKGVNVNDYRRPDGNKPQISGVDSMVTTIVETLEYILKAKGIETPQDPYGLEQWLEVEANLREKAGEY